MTLTYELGFLEGIEGRDQNLPPDEQRFPEVAYSTGVSWQTMATEYSKIVDGRANPAAVQTIVDQLIAGKKTGRRKRLRSSIIWIARFVIPALNSVKQR